MVRTVLASVVILVSGMVVALVGGVAHRSEPWWGLVGSIALVVSAGLFVRAWRQWLALAIFAGAWVGVTTMLALEGPGGSILIVDDALGQAWLWGGSVALIVVAVAPPSWVAKDPDVAN